MSGVEQALALARLGLCVVPINCVTKVACVKWKPFQERRPAEEETRQHWRDFPRAGTAIITGHVSGIVAIDIDPRHDGNRTWRDLVWRHGSPEHTWHAFTPSGGEHWYFRLRPGTPYRDTEGDLGPGIDTRANGGLIIAPPSIRNGRSYVWAVGGCPWPISPDEPAADLADPPPWLAAMLDGIEARRTARATPPSSSTPAPRVTTHDAYLRAAVDRELEAVRSAPDGARNATLNRAAFGLGRFVASGALSGDAAAAALHHAALSAGLGAHEAAATIASGLRASTRSAAA